MSYPELDPQLDAFERCLESEDVPGARRCLGELRASLPADDPELLYAEARLVWLEHGAEAARPLLERVVEVEPRHNDAHHDLGCLAEERDDREAMIRHFLRVRA